MEIEDKLLKLIKESEEATKKISEEAKAVFNEMLNTKGFEEMAFETTKLKMSVLMIGCELHVRITPYRFKKKKHVHICAGFGSNSNVIYGLDGLDNTALAYYANRIIVTMWETYKVTM